MTAKLPSCTPHDVEEALFDCGFFCLRDSGDHKILMDASRKHRVTLPRHNKDLKRKTLHTIIKQAGLTKDEFHALLRGEAKSQRAA